MTKKIIYIIFLLSLILNGCQWINDNEEKGDAPTLPTADEFIVKMNFVGITSRDDSYSNWNAAVKATSDWEKKLDEYHKIFDLLKICSGSTPEYFSTNTWYWRIDMDTSIFELYATKFSETETFIEGYLERTNYNKKTTDSLKIISGYYFPNSLNGNFELYQNKDTLIINWTQNYINYTVTNPSLDIKQLHTQKLGYATNYLITYRIYKDTAKIILNYNNSGKINFYPLLKDKSWHCWDTEHKNTDCDDN